MIWYANQGLRMCLFSSVTGVVTSQITHWRICSGQWILEPVPILTNNSRNWKNFVRKLRWCAVNSGVAGSTIGDENMRRVLQKTWYRESRICSIVIFLSVFIWLTAEPLSDIGEVLIILLILPCAVPMIMTLLSVKPVGRQRSISCFAIYWEHIFLPVKRCLKYLPHCRSLKFLSFILQK